MKKFTLLSVALLMFSLSALAQIKMYLHFNDGTRVEYIASRVDSITFDSQTHIPDEPDKPEENPDVPVGPKPDEGVPDANGHDYVDLGLPSGTLWATMNVGATSPEDYGDYFAWGETSSKAIYNWSTYKWMTSGMSSWKGVNKYTIADDQTSGVWYNSYGNFIGDNKTTLELSDDAANASWGGDWRMPTKAEQDELRNSSYTTWTWTTQNGVNGYKVTSKTNGNSIFLPAAGSLSYSYLYDAGSFGYYWSSSLSTDYSNGAYSLNFDSSNVDWGNNRRDYGRSVRPVLRDVEFTFTLMFDGNGGEGTMPAIDGQHDDRVKIPASTFTRDGYYFVGWNTKANGSGTSYSADESIILTADLTLYAQWEESKGTGTANGHDWVDLGLPSGTKWATCNVGADSPEDYGDYFAWGETTPKSTYDWSTYKWCNASYDTQTKYCTDSEYGTVDNKTTLELSDDAAYVNWGSSWRMPTKAEQDELTNANYTTWTWTTQNGVNGYKVTSKTNGNSIFLPAAGYRYYSDLINDGSYGYYWSSSLYTDYSDVAYDLNFRSSDVDWDDNSRDLGQSVRSVLAE